MKSKKKLAILVGSLVMVVILLATLLPLVVFADVPQRINYQGYLTDSGGNPVDGSVNIVFSIYDVAAGGTAIWTESQTVAVNKGLFNVQLGSVNALPSFSASPRYLGIKVGADPEMTPRQLLASAPYALNADTVDGLHSTAFVLKSGDTMSGNATGAAVLTVSNTGNGNGIRGQTASSTDAGVLGYATGSTGKGVNGYASYYGNVTNYGGYFQAFGDQGRGVYGYADGSSGIGVYGKATGANAYAGYFEGDVQVTGDLTVTGGIRGPNPMQIALLRWYDANQSGITFPVGSGPVGICFDGANIWVANNNSNNVTKL
jgi:hypothetical protein